MIKIFNNLLLLGLLAFGYSSFAQSTRNHYTLKDAISYGVSNQRSIKTSQLEMDKYNFQFKQVLSAFLPQINADASYAYNMKLISQIIPGELIGQPGENVAVQFGTKFNAVGNIIATQTLIDIPQLTALKIVQHNKQFAFLKKEKTIDQSIYDIASTYYYAQIAYQQKLIIKRNMLQNDSLIVVANSQFKSGFSLEIDLKRLQVNKLHLEAEFKNADLEYEQHLVLLKYYMAYPLENEISIDTNENSDYLMQPLEEFLVIRSIDLDLMKVQSQITELEIKQLKQSYLPKLSLSFNYGTQVQEEKANIFKRSVQWYPNSLIAANLTVPIFDGFYKSSRIKELKLVREQNHHEIKNIEEMTRTQKKNNESKLKIAISNLNSLASAIKLAEEVYKVTKVQYEKGVTTLSELLNAEGILLISQTNYSKALAQVQIARLDLLKTRGDIQTILNK